MDGSRIGGGGEGLGGGSYSAALTVCVALSTLFYFALRAQTSFSR